MISTQLPNEGCALGTHVGHTYVALPVALTYCERTSMYTHQYLCYSGILLHLVDSLLENCSSCGVTVVRRGSIVWPEARDAVRK